MRIKQMLSMFLAAMMLLTLSACTKSSDKVQLFSVDTGDEIWLRLDKKSDYELVFNDPYLVIKDGETILRVPSPSRFYIRICWLMCPKTRTLNGSRSSKRMGIRSLYFPRRRRIPVRMRFLRSSRLQTLRPARRSLVPKPRRKSWTRLTPLNIPSTRCQHLLIKLKQGGLNYDKENYLRDSGSRLSGDTAFQL